MIVRSFLCALAVVALATVEAQAAVPTSTTVEGALTSAGGGAAADGNYDVTFSVYAAKGATKATWSEGPVKVAVKGGRFSYALGTSKALTSTALAGLAQAWLGIKIGADPELPRQRMHSAPYALVADRAMQLACTGCVSASQVANGGISAAKVGFNYAGSTTKGGPASDLACTGCVSSKEMKFDGDINLGGNSLKAKNGTFTGDVAAGTVTATSFIGDGSKLTGIKTPSGECKTAGEVVKGINADGSLKCVKAMDPAALPKDGLNEISNDLISNQFVDTIETSQKMVPIPDNQGSEAVSNLTFPNIGVAQKFDLFVHVENTDLSKVAVTVLPPNDKKTGWVVCDPCGGKDAKILKKTYNASAKPKSGDIAYWTGKNPQGLWNLKVKDTSFCIPQAPGNAKYCNTTKKQDGWIATWNIKIQTLSNQKIAVKGNQYTTGGLKLGSTSACGTANYGMLRWGGAQGLQACNGTQWVAAKPEPIVFRGSCKHSRDESSSWNYYCLSNWYEKTAVDRGYISVSNKTPASVSDSYDSQWQNDSQVGRVTVNIPGYYRVSWTVRGQPYRYLSTRVLRNGKEVSYQQSSGGSTYYDKSTSHNLVLLMTKGQYLNFQADTDTDNGSSYAFFSNANGNVTIEYLGQTWK